MSKEMKVVVKIDEDKIKIPVKVKIGFMCYDGFLSKDKLYLEESKNNNGL